MSTIIKAAVRLHDFIRANAGPSAEWPLQITASESGVIDRLDTLLREFRDAVTEPQRNPRSTPPTVMDMLWVCRDFIAEPMLQTNYPEGRRLLKEVDAMLAGIRTLTSVR